MFSIIRATQGFNQVVVVTPEDAEEGDEGAQYYRYSTLVILAGQAAGQFHAIGEDVAMDYFSGHADGLGWADHTDKPFESLEDILAYIAEKQGG